MLKRSDPQAELAVVRYGPNDLQILKPGRVVLCAVTGAPIPIEELRYWNVELQEAYASPEAAMTRWRQLHGQA